MKNTFKSLILSCAVLISASPIKAQTYLTSLTGEVQYPDVTMTPSSYNLDKANTKYLSNHSFPGMGPLTGSIIEVAGWSTDNDGGFTFGTSSLGTYTGIGAVAIANARDVQVGFMDGGSGQYIVAAYYDVSINHYCYNLYKWNLGAGSCSLLYKFKFRKPNVVMPDYIENTDYSTPFPSTYPPAPDFLSTTMDYDRISLDINRDGNKIAFVLGDAADGRMYISVGIIGADTLQLCPSLLNTNMSLVHSAPSGLPTTAPVNIITAVSPYTGWTSVGGGAYDYYDSYSGQYVRYYTSGALAGKYHYSYYPIDEWTFVTEYDGTTCTQLPSNRNFNPLIGMHATGHVTTPGLNPRYRQRWGDVAFSEWAVSPPDQLLNFVFYADYSTTIGDLYVADNVDFSGLYNYTNFPSWGPWPTYVAEYPNDMIIGSVNSADGRSLSSDFGPGGAFHDMYGPESWTISLPTSRPIRAKIDCADNAGYNSWAITFAYKATTADFGIGSYYEPTDPLHLLHAAVDRDLNNIFVRYPYKNQIVANNGSMAHYSGGPLYAADNIREAKDPSISWDAAGNYFALAWVSERAGLVNSVPFGYVGCKIDPYTPTTIGIGSPGSYYTMPDYLYISNDPTLDCGATPVISLSKHDYGLSDIYTAFAQEDNSSTYSIVHKDNVWTSASTWRKASGGVDGISAISVTPNPFSTHLTVRGAGTLVAALFDITGRQLVAVTGTESQVNEQINTKMSHMLPGLYSLRIKPEKGTEQAFKLTKL